MKAIMACRHEAGKKGSCRFGANCEYSHDDTIIAAFNKRLKLREQIKKYDEAKAKKEKRQRAASAVPALEAAAATAAVWA